MPIRAIIFDCDGTLVDSETLANRVLVEYAAEFGLMLSLEEAMVRFVGSKMDDCVADLENQLGKALPEHFVPEFRRRMDRVFETELEPLPGAHALLARLEHPLAVASSGPRAKIELSLGVTGLRPFFSDDLIFSAYEIGHWKPDPEIVLCAADALSVDPAECLVVEDSVPGIRGGVAAGMPTIAFRQGEGQALELGAVAVLDSLTDLPDVIAHL
jgi:HAD superfamily hydrolase (TIGR01509 family)